MSQDQNWQPPGQDPETQQDWPQGPPTPPPGWAQQGQGPQDQGAQQSPPGWGQPQQPPQAQPTGWAPQTPLQQPQGGQNPPPGWTPGPQTPPPGWAPQQPQPGWSPQGPPGPQTPPPGSWQPPGQQFGPPPPGYAPQGQYAQPGKKNKGVVAAVAVAGVAVLALAGAVVFVALNGDDGEKKPPPVAPAAKSAAASTTLKTIPGLHYKGTFEADGDTIQADLSVTRTGSASGQLTIDGDGVELMIVDGTSYVKAPRSYWRKQSDVGETGAPDYADRWAKAPVSLSGFDLRGKLLPSQLGDGVSTAQPLIPPSGQPTAEAVAGTQAIGFEGTDYQYFVTDAAPYKLVKIKGGGEQSFDLDVTELTAQQTGDVFTQLKEKVKGGLSGAPDSASRVVSTGKPDNSNCKTASGCTIHQEVRNSGSDAGVRITATIKSGTIEKPGPVLGSCTTRTTTVKSGATAKLTCRVTSSGWTKWVKGLKPGSKNNSYNFGTKIFTEAVPADKVDDLIGKLDQEQQGA